ncbi:MAG: NUDIX hydrolase [Lachnospiraceae bacterium]
MAEQFKRLDRKLVYHGHIVDFYEDTMQVPNGNIVKWDFIKHNGAAAVVPVLDDGRILMVKQYRNALDKEIWEIPAGGLNGQEPFIECSHRELEEETGYHCELEDMEFLISIASTVAFCNERIDVYVAKNLVKTSQHLDEDEFINVKPYTTDELKKMIFAGEIQDAKTIASIMSYINKYECDKHN